MPEIIPFKIQIANATLEDLKTRIKNTRWPEDLPGAEWEYGVPATYIKPLADYWLKEYDWRKWEEKLNQYPQFTTEIDGQKYISCTSNPTFLMRYRWY